MSPLSRTEPRPTVARPAAVTEAPPRPGNRGDLNDLSGTDWIKATKSWFVCDSRRYHRNRSTELHPARYPEEMASEFISFFSRAGGWVLDPFCGSGATLVSCHELGRNGVGLELSPRYARIARGRLPAAGSSALGVIEADARRATDPALWAELPQVPRSPEGLPAFDLILTSPPYWNMLSQSRGGVLSAHQRRALQGLDTDYGQDPADLGAITDYDEFIEALGGIFDGCARLLAPNRYLVCVVQNCRTPQREVKPLAWDLARRISQTLSFQGERIWCQNSKRLGIWGFPKVFVPNYHHHYCLIFQRRTT